MSYEKIDEKNFKEIETEETAYNVDELKKAIAFYEGKIAELNALLVQAKALGLIT